MIEHVEEELQRGPPLFMRDTWVCLGEVGLLVAAEGAQVAVVVLQAVVVAPKVAEVALRETVVQVLARAVVVELRVVKVLAQTAATETQVVAVGVQPEPGPTHPSFHWLHGIALLGVCTDGSLNHGPSLVECSESFSFIDGGEKLLFEKLTLFSLESE